MANEIMLNATSQDAIITYKNPLISAFTISGAGITQRMTLNDVEDVVTEIGADGTMIAYYKAALLTGTITLQGTSNSLISIRKVLTAQSSLKSAIPGTLLVVSPSGIWSETYNNFVFTTKFKGFDLGEKIAEVSIKFSALNCEQTNLGGILSTGLALGGLGGLI
jgi:hypothetical protein